MAQAGFLFCNWGDAKERRDSVPIPLLKGMIPLRIPNIGVGIFLYVIRRARQNVPFGPGMLVKLFT